jgi:predicted TIM-barrel fold metal-dependent hydrolase
LIVDCHTHLNRYTAADAPTLRGRRDRLLTEMDAHGIARALVLTSYKVSEDRPGLREVGEVVGEDERLGVVAGVSMQHGTAAGLAEARRGLAEGWVRGLKLYPGYEPFDLAGRETWAVYELAAEFRVPVMIHTGDTYDPGARVRFAHPLAVDDAAVAHRDVTFVICHLGNPWFTDAMEVLYKNENVVGDFCGLTLGDFQPRFERWARERVDGVLAYLNDPSKLMFGTDWPICGIASYLRFAASLDATPQEQEGMMWRNASRVFGLGLETAQGDEGGERNRSGSEAA